MGFNYSLAGYSNVFDFVKDMKWNVGRNLDAFLHFCRRNPALLVAMEHKDFQGMAYNYNGNDYGDYDQKIRAVYQKLSGTR